jgi:translation initiation factor 2B subunit (eIF-2B alpha/beta/delta family)
MFGAFDTPATFADTRLKSAMLREDTDNDTLHLERLQLPCPLLDYVEPEDIDLLITDSGGLTPSYIYRLLSEFYAREDFMLSKELLDRMVGH